jgi:hypothetical protein
MAFNPFQVAPKRHWWLSVPFFLILVFGVMMGLIAFMFIVSGL